MKIIFRIYLIANLNNGFGYVGITTKTVAVAV